MSVFFIRVFVSYSCASSPGQSDQAAVLWRRTSPTHTDAGWQGERESVEEGKMMVAIKEVGCSHVMNMFLDVTCLCVFLSGHHL